VPTLEPVTDPEEPISIVDVVAPILDSCRALAEALAHLLLST
jgi:hypothetical protein